MNSPTAKPSDPAHVHRTWVSKLNQKALKGYLDMLAYFDCFSGIAGDMTLAALIDLGLEPSFLEQELSRLQLDGYNLQVSSSKQGGITGIRFHVEVSSDQPHRKYGDIRKLIADSSLGDDPKTTALRVFDILAGAEARVHGVSKEGVHFREKGAVDCIVDIVGVAVGIHALGIEKIVCSPLPLNRGFVKTAPGMLPLPTPVVMEILNGVPVEAAESSIELITPTGAAIARGLTSEFSSFPSFTPLKTGYGLGKSDPQGTPNALRVILGESHPAMLSRDQVGILECQVDDLDHRFLGYLMEFLPGKGALDVTFAPVQMKKNRPGILITVLVAKEKMHEVATVLLTHTTTLGVRVSLCERWILERKAEDVSTSLGSVRVKTVSLPDGRTERRCEFEEIRTISLRTGKPLREIFQILDRELNG